MSGFRAWWNGEPAPDGTALLDEAESRHLVKALRARSGDTVTLFDAEGRAWDARLAETADKRARCAIVSPIDVSAPLSRIALAVCLPKGKTFDGIVRQAVEIGVDDLFPLLSEHCEVRLDASRAASKLTHWNDQLREAMKQCGNLHPPRISPLESLADFLEAEPMAGQRRFVASLQPGARHLHEALATNSAASAQTADLGSTLVLVGPEGDFSAAEYAAIMAAGFSPVSLGAHVLRVETACAYAGAVLDAVRPRSSKIA